MSRAVARMALQWKGRVAWKGYREEQLPFGAGNECRQDGNGREVRGFGTKRVCEAHGGKHRTWN